MRIPEPFNDPTWLWGAEPPALATLQPLTPPALDRLVRQCLAKAPDDRPDTAHDVANELRWVRETSGVAALTGTRPRRRLGVRTALTVASGLLLIVAGAGLTWLLRPSAPVSVVRPSLDVRPAEEVNAGGVGSVPTAGGSRTALTWTPDGQALVFVGRRGGVQQLYVRRLDAAEARVLPDTDGAQVPAVSPDGQRFYTYSKLTPPPSPVVTHINLILNWLEELKAKVPVR